MVNWSEVVFRDERRAGAEVVVDPPPPASPPPRARGAVLVSVIPDVPAEWMAGCAKLANSAAPAGWPPLRWEMLKRDAVDFITRWGASAARLGWSSLDLFGVAASAPFARIDMMGLLPLVAGAEIAELCADRAMLTSSAGGRLTFHRASHAAGTGAMVNVWELEPAPPPMLVETDERPVYQQDLF